MPDSLRLAIGTFTAWKVRPPSRLGPDVARGAMLWAPAVGAALGLLAAVILDWDRIFTSAFRPVSIVDLLGSALALGAVAYATRGIHLDGLADTADAFGVKDAGDAESTRAARLAVMRRPEIGAFGVVVVVFTVLIQVTALAEAATSGFATASCIFSVMVGRLAMTWACALPVPPARPDGLGALVARTVPVWAAAAWTVLLLGAATVVALVDTEGPHTAHHRMIGVLCGAILIALAAAWFVVHRARQRLGGITGDVLGAAGEVATTTFLVVTAIGIGMGLFPLGAH